MARASVNYRKSAKMVNFTSFRISVEKTANNKILLANIYQFIGYQTHSFVTIKNYTYLFQLTNLFLYGKISLHFNYTIFYLPHCVFLVQL